MVTRKGPSRSVHAIDDGREAEHKRLVTWLREKMKKVAANTSSLEEIIDPMLEGGETKITGVQSSKMTKSS
uniref:Uncharacterized protein n=1 Tax=Quercus lobata TaxID=97700 RepID=A0A7N2N786_QUELO